MRREESSNSCTKTAANTREKFKYSRIAALSYNNMTIKNHATRNALSALNTYCANTIFRISSKKEKKNLSHDLTSQYSSSFWFFHCDYLENNLTRTQLGRNPKSFSGQSNQWKQPCQLHPMYKHYLLKQDKSGSRPSTACLCK